MLTAVSSMVVAGMTAAGGVVTVVVGRRQPRAESRRNDFKVITEEQNKQIGRQNQKIQRLETRLDDAEADAERDRRKIAGQEFALRYFVSWVRDLVGYIRRAGLEPPLPPQPVPDEVQPYMHDVGV